MSRWELLIATVLALVMFCFIWSKCGSAVTMDPLPNTVTALFGIGPDGVQVTNNGHTVAPFVAPLWGLEYEHRFAATPWSVSILGMTGTTAQTKTFIGATGVGWSF